MTARLLVRARYAAPMPDLAAVYDAIPYPTYPALSAHPDRLATVARMTGLATKPANRCRLLELGCGDGMNLVPMAVALPESRFVGIDLSPAAIARGNEAISQLALKNVTLAVGDIARLDRGLGLFDYIVAHGVYSWVPEHVRDRLLAACKTHLEPNGVAYVSYNTMPGGHVRLMLREMALFHIRNVVDPLERVAEARAFASFVARSGGPNIPDTYRDLLTAQATLMASRGDADIYHDDLADLNDPVYVSEFMASASKHGLQFLGEADFFEMSADAFSEEASAAINGLEEQDIVVKEQYLDMLKCRQFRKTLLCHDGLPLNRAFDANAVASMYVRSDARPGPAAEGVEEGALSFSSPTRGAVTTANALAKAALTLLFEAFPAAIAFGTLSAEANARSGEELSAFKATQRMAELVYSAFRAGTVDLHVQPPHMVTALPEFPEASLLVRWQLRDGPGRVTNLRHESIQVDGEQGRALILLLDGTRDRAALAAHPAMLAAFAPETTPEEVLAAIETNLVHLGRAGLLR